MRLLTKNETKCINGGVWQYVGAFGIGIASSYAYELMGGAEGIAKAFNRAKNYVREITMSLYPGNKPNEQM